MKKKFLFLLLFISLLFIKNETVLADDPNPSFGDLNVELEYPENQLNKESTYFDLVAPPKTKQELIVKVTNTSKETRTVSTNINRGFTNSSGTISYSSEDKTDAPGLVYDITDIVTIKENQIKIKPNETKKISIFVDVPEKDYPGILLGALYLLDETPVKSKGNIKNSFAYEVGIVLQSNEDSKRTSDELILKDVKANQKNYRNIILLDLENNQPGFFGPFSLTADVYKKGSKNSFVSVDQKELTMAPNSVLNYPMYLDDKIFEAGTYTLKGEIVKNDTIIPLDKEFIITKEDVKKFNSSDLTIPPKKWYENILIVISLIIGIILLILIIIIVNNKLRNNSQNKQSKNSKSKNSKSKNSKSKNSKSKNSKSKNSKSKNSKSKNSKSKK